MRRFLPLLLIAPLALLTACHIHEDEEDDDFFVVEEVPPGGVDWGTFNHFEHDFNTASISTSDDKDGYEFFLAEDSVVVLTTTGGGVDTFLDLYEGGFDFIAGNDNGGPGTDSIIVASLPPGDYFAVVGGVGGSTGDYDVDISVEPMGGADFGEMFSGDSFVDTGGVIDDPFDVDSYIFTVYNNVTADIFVTTVSGSFDGNLELVDEYGGVIVFTDPAGNADPDILNEPLTPGTYIVRVGASSGSGAYDTQIDVN